MSNITQKEEETPKRNWEFPATVVTAKRVTPSTENERGTVNYIGTKERGTSSRGTEFILPGIASQTGQSRGMLQRRTSAQDEYAGPILSAAAESPYKPFEPGFSEYNSVTVTKPDIINWIRKEKIPAAWQPSTFDRTNPLHEFRVREIVNYFLYRAAKEWRGLSRYDLMVGAKAKLGDMRGDKDIPRSSESLLLRDAERYLWGRVGIEVAKRQYHHPQIRAEVVEPLIDIFYNFLKRYLRPINDGLRLLGAEKGWMEVDPGKPLSAPGGSGWFDLGLQDYWRLDREAMDTKTLPPLLDYPINWGDQTMLDQMLRQLDAL